MRYILGLIVAGGLVLGQTIACKVRQTYGSPGFSSGYYYGTTNGVSDSGYYYGTGNYRFYQSFLLTNAMCKFPG